MNLGKIDELMDYFSDDSVTTHHGDNRVPAHGCFRGEECDNGLNIIIMRLNIYLNQL